MSERSHEIVFDAVPPEEVVFNPDRVAELHGYVTKRLEFFHVPTIFEHDDRLTDDEVRGLVSLYVLTSDDKRPTIMREGKAPETIEEFVARTVLIPMLCEPATDQKDFRGTHRTLAYSMSELYKERLQSQWSVEQKKQLISNDYTSFIRSTGQKLAQRIAKNQFEGSAPSPDEITTQRLVRKARTDSVPPSREQVQWVLKPDRPDMPAKVKLVRDIFEVAGLDREEAAKIRQMISGSQTTVNLHAATARALEKLRGVCHAAAASKQLQMTPGEVKRIQAMLSINNPESLYDQIYESQRNGDLNARIIENELLSGLRKVVDAYTQSIKTNPAQDGLADKN